MSNQTTFVERLSITEEWRGSGYIKIVTEKEEEKMLRFREKLFFFFLSHLTVTVQPVHGRYSKGRQRGKAMAGFRTIP